MGIFWAREQTRSGRRSQKTRDFSLSSVYRDAEGLFESRPLNKRHRKANTRRSSCGWRGEDKQPALACRREFHSRQTDRSKCDGRHYRLQSEPHESGLDFEGKGGKMRKSEGGGGGKN